MNTLLIGAVSVLLGTERISFGGLSTREAASGSRTD